MHSRLCSRLGEGSHNPGLRKVSTFGTRRKFQIQAHASEDQTSNGAAQKHNTKITVFSAQNYVKVFLKQKLETVFPNSTFVDPKLDATTAALANGSEVVCLFVNDVCNDEVIARLAEGGTKLIAMRCAGYDKIDIEAADAAGISIARVPTYSPHSVAEMAVTLVLSLNRSIHLAYNRVREGNYTLSGLIGFELGKRVVGIVGTGNIGAAACQIFKGFGCRVLAHDLYPSKELQEIGVEYLSLEEMLPQCDIISLHCPLLPSTAYIIDRARIAQMKQGTMLINVSRGGLVDTEAAIEGLESGKIGALGMDVYEGEEDLFFKDFTALSSEERMKSWDRRLKLLLSFPNVILTPHSAFLTHEALASIAATTVDNIRVYAEGGEMEGRNWVLDSDKGDRKKISDIQKAGNKQSR